MAALGHPHICPCSEHSRFSPCSWRGAGTKPQQGTEPPGKKAELPTRPSPKAARIQANPGKVRLPPPASAAVRSECRGEGHARELGWLCGPCFPSEARLSLDTQVHQAHVRQALGSFGDGVWLLDRCLSVSGAAAVLSWFCVLVAVTDGVVAVSDERGGLSRTRTSASSCRLPACRVLCDAEQGPCAVRWMLCASVQSRAV